MRVEQVFTEFTYPAQKVKREFLFSNADIGDTDRKFIWRSLHTALTSVRSGGVAWVGRSEKLEKTKLSSAEARELSARALTPARRYKGMKDGECAQRFAEITE